MAIAGVVYGNIKTVWSPLSGHALHRHNKAILRSLPRADLGPPLSGMMFGITGPGRMEGSYDYSIIHFGGSIRAFDIDDAKVWIQKFEGLLSRLYWIEATLHIDWIFHDRMFQWKVDEERYRDVVLEGKAGRLDKWTFDDGGRPLDWEPPK